MTSPQRRLLSGAIVAATLCAQADRVAVQPLRTAPSERITASAGFRDWGPATVAGNTILAGNQTGRGGLFAIDMATGKVRWAYHPVFANGTASVSTPPAVSGQVVIVPFATGYPGTVAGVSLATGKEIWRGPEPARDAAVATADGLAYVYGQNGTFYALDAVTGGVRWKVAWNANRAGCASQPLVSGDTVYTTGNAGTAGNFLFALDARTGQERWRYRAEAPYVHDGTCLHQPVIGGDTIFAAGESHLYAVEMATGRNRWPPAETRLPVNGEVRAADVRGLVAAGPVLVGMTPGFLIAFDMASGKMAWQLPGQYSETAPATAVAGNVLYFQGSPAAKPAVAPRGTLHALDLDTRSILWSFSRPTAEANWPFGHVTPVDGGLWVNSYQALVKLQ
jgi:outer membrane protein assembly factor BamB